MRGYPSRLSYLVGKDLQVDRQQGFIDHGETTFPRPFEPFLIAMDDASEVFHGPERLLRLPIRFLAVIVHGEGGSSGAAAD